jgi:hypothetical protein
MLRVPPPNSTPALDGIDRTRIAPGAGTTVTVTFPAVRLIEQAAAA